MNDLKTPKVLVPKSKIPPAHPVCVECLGPMAAAFGTAFAEGYHRRHVCKDKGCGAAVYSLADYETKKIQYSPAPFKDRALTELELLKRDQWWEEEANYTVTIEVTPLDIPARMQAALSKKENQRDDIDNYLVERHNEMLTYIKNNIELELMDD